MQIAPSKDRAGAVDSTGMNTRYLTDGVHLYEIAEQRTVENYGVRRGTISYTIIRDVVSEAVARVDDLHLAALTEVSLDSPNLV